MRATLNDVSFLVSNFFFFSLFLPPIFCPGWFNYVFTFFSPLPPFPPFSKLAATSPFSAAAAAAAATGAAAAAASGDRRRGSPGEALDDD